MSHTNSTPNYSLPQFLSSDKPAWMADINTAMSAIDTGMKANADATTNAQSTADKAVLNGAPGYSNLSTYDVDDVVNYQGRVYKCVIAVPTPEAFDDAKWILYDLQDASKAIDDIDFEIGSGDISGIGDGSVKGAILEINSNLSDVDDRQDANEFGTLVGLAPGNSYTTPSDGFVCITFGASSNLKGYVEIKDANGTNANMSIGSSNSGNTYETFSCFVKKGMQLKLTSDSTATAYFVPVQ